MTKQNRYLDALDYLKFALKQQNIRQIKSVMEIVKSMLAVDLAKLDADPYLLNTPEATYRLTDGLGGRQEHNPNDYCTKSTAVDPGDKGKALWLNALNEIFCGNQDLIDYVQEVVGLCAIGKVLIEALYIAYGGGRNGKSTFFNLVSRVLGSYAGNVSADTLTTGCRRNTKPELAELRGKRLVLASELEDNSKLDTSMLKQLASTDTIYGEKKFYAPAAFTPTHTTILCTNYFPRVDATDNGTWRRLIVIPFHAVFEENTDRKNYADDLYEHAAPAVLAWIIEGARRIIAKNYHLEPPKIIHDAIDEYRAENDWFSDYLTDCCETRDDFSEQSGALYQEYRAHCIRMGKPVRSTTVFYDALKRQGYTKARTNHGVVVYGLRIKRQ